MNKGALRMLKKSRANSNYIVLDWLSVLDEEPDKAKVLKPTCKLPSMFRGVHRRPISKTEG
jgi:hypothetical protein